MFDIISSKLTDILYKLGKKGKLSPQDVKSAMKDFKKILLEADVNYRVTQSFCDAVEKEATGEKVLKSFTPKEMITKIVYEKLIEILGKGEELNLKKSPSPIMLIGLQGAGKTTTAIKLALFLQKKGRKSLVVPCDVKRPAAYEQLKTLADMNGIPFFERKLPDVVRLSKIALSQAVLKRYDVVIFDTAGRLHIDKEMIQEAERIRDTVTPDEILLVADGMTGQDAVNIAQEFKNTIGLTGVILTKMDGDARGGAALSIRKVTDKPIKFLGIGEKVDALEQFYPDRLASRILGMGDLSSLQEKAQQVMDVEKAAELQRKIKEAELTLEDFLYQIKQMKRMGSFDEVLEMLPGGKGLKNMLDERMLIKTEAIINSMTKGERKNPKIIDGSRKRRIAKGSGTDVHDINEILREYEMVQKMLKQMKKGKMKMPFPIRF